MKMTKLEDKAAEVRELLEFEREITFEVGRILLEVKQYVVEKGDWLAWLEGVGLNARTSQRYMQVYSRFNGIEGARELSIGKLSELLALPAGVDVSEFIKNAENQTTREIREAVKATKPAKESPQKVTYASRVINSIKNLSCYYSQKLENSELSLDAACEIGNFSTHVQVQMVDFEPVARGIHYVIIGKMLKSQYKEDDIREVLRKFDAVCLFSVDEELLQAIEGEEIAEFIDILDKLHLRKQRARQESRSNTISLLRKKADIRQLLGLPDEATMEDVQSEYRKVIKILHTDHGGHAGLFQTVKEAYDEYRAVIKEAV